MLAFSTVRNAPNLRSVCVTVFPSHRAWHTTLRHIGRPHCSPSFLRSLRVDKIGGTNTSLNLPICQHLATTAILQLDIHKSTNFKGYTALLGENTNPENRGDLHEGFDLGWEDLESGTVRSSEDDGSMAGGNVWPDDTILPGFRRAVLEY